MDIFDFLNMTGGLALFLYGMSAMGNGLSKMAGGKLESILERLTAKRIYAVLLGAAVTAVIQSSSATTVMVVGFVNSGIMQLSQSVGIIMGANIGTTITSWILSLTGIEGSNIWLKLLKPSSFSPVLAAVGIILTMTGRDESKKKDIGNILLGFAILMFGMETMSSSVSGLKENADFCSMMTRFSNPVLGMVVGAVLTAIIQSSSASVGILQALCSTGAISYAVALPIIMGQNIGTCVTSIISSVGASKNAKRASMIHLYFNLIGTVTFMLVFYAINYFVSFAFLGRSANAAGIAVIHSLFNIGATIVLFPFSDKLVRLAEITIPDGGQKDLADGSPAKKRTAALDERFLESPAFAVEICRQKAFEMAAATQEALITGLRVIQVYDDDKVKLVEYLEDLIDDYEDALGSYLVRLSSKNLSMKDSQSLSQMLHSISDLERISDHAMNLAEAAVRMKEQGLEFSRPAGRELAVICRAVEDVVTETTEIFTTDDLEGAKHVEPLEEVIDALTKKIKNHHVRRLQKGKCTIELGLILEDVLNDLERVSDHCSNIAVEMLTIHDNGYETHEYLDDMSESEKAGFKKEYEILKSKYSLKQDDDTIDNNDTAEEKKRAKKSRKD